MKNLDSKNLNIGIWGGNFHFFKSLYFVENSLNLYLISSITDLRKGDVRLESLELKEEALNSFNLPFGVKKGTTYSLVSNLF